MAYGSVDETDSRRGNDSSGDFAVCKDQVHGLSFDAEPPVHRVSIAYPPMGRTNVDNIVCGADAFDPCVCVACHLVSAQSSAALRRLSPQHMLQRDACEGHCAVCLWVASAVAELAVLELMSIGARVCV